MLFYSPTTDFQGANSRNAELMAEARAAMVKSAPPKMAPEDAKGLPKNIEKEMESTLSSVLNILDDEEDDLVTSRRQVHFSRRLTLIFLLILVLRASLSFR